MKEIILLSIAIMGLTVLGAVHAAPPSLENQTGVVVMATDGPDASNSPAQLARRSDRCKCCRKTPRGVTKCTWMTHWRCRIHGGRCAK